MNDVPAKRKLPKFVRVIRARPRLFLSALIGLLFLAALPMDWRLASRMLIGWDVGVSLYLIAAYQLIARADVGGIRRRAAIQDEGGYAILVLTVCATLASFIAIFVELGTHGSSGREPLRLALATVTIVVSWVFIHTIFALHYAHEFYHARSERGDGLAFPGGEEPGYWDFVYFSFVIGMTSQVSDVAVTSKTIRKTVAAHGIISFVFNVTLLALMVNIAASAI